MQGCRISSRTCALLSSDQSTTDTIKTVFRCLYSQCQTAQFGSALHFTLIECVDHKVQNSMVVPKLIGQHDLRKRVEHYPGFGSMVSSASVIQSSQRRYASVSASTSARPTRSAAYGALRALNNSASQWTVSSAFGVTTTLIKITNTPLVS